jgi:CD2 antigen cytoplasmic tail-binding protein 2
MLTRALHRLEFPNTASTRRNAVVTEGYDDDSSDEDVSGKAGPAAAVDDEDDMFATTAPESKAPDEDRGPRDGLLLASGSSKKKQFLDMEDIVGQETGKTPAMLSEGEDDEEDFEEGDEHANDDDAPRSRRSKKSMGYVIDGFNMKEELKEGKIDADGNYTATTGDPLAVHDTWLNGVSSKADLKATRAAKARADARRAEQEKADALVLPRVDALRAIADSGLVRRHETILAALSRHGQAKRRGDADAPRRIADLTALVSGLFDVHGENDVYEQTCDDIVRTLRLEGEVRRGWEPPTWATEDGAEGGMDVDGAETAAQATARRTGLIARPTAPVERHGRPKDPNNDLPRFYYRWAPGSGAPAEERDAVHGPYTHAQLTGWVGASYFGGQAERIQVRVEGHNDWTTWGTASAL